MSSDQYTDTAHSKSKTEIGSLSMISTLIARSIRDREKTKITRESNVRKVRQLSQSVALNEVHDTPQGPLFMELCLEWHA